MPEQAPPIPLAPKWVCLVVRSGYHNGAGCTSLEPHLAWGCGWRYELTLPATPASAGLLAEHGFTAPPAPGCAGGGRAWLRSAGRRGPCPVCPVCRATAADVGVAATAELPATVPEHPFVPRGG
jgi:hypothetical protein